MASPRWEMQAEREYAAMPPSSVEYTAHERQLWLAARAASLEARAHERRCRWLTATLCLVPALLIMAYGLGAAWGH